MIQFYFTLRLAFEKLNGYITLIKAPIHVTVFAVMVDYSKPVPKFASSLI